MRKAARPACRSSPTRPSFQGAPEYLTQAREATRLPVLRKDFMIEPYQVVEARSWGADCILIIMAMLDDDHARALLDEAARWEMDALVEVHDEAELERALDLDAGLIGINNRNLKTFVTDMGVTLKLAPKVPQATCMWWPKAAFPPRPTSSAWRGAHVTSVLVGESLMRQKDVARRHPAFAGQRLSVTDEPPHPALGGHARQSARGGRTPRLPANEAANAARRSPQPERVSGVAATPSPKVLMGEVAAPRGVEIGKQREAFRAFMTARRLRPSDMGARRRRAAGRNSRLPDRPRPAASRRGRWKSWRERPRCASKISSARKEKGGPSRTAFFLKICAGAP